MKGARIQALLVVGLALVAGLTAACGSNDDGGRVRPQARESAEQSPDESPSAEAESTPSPEGEAEEPPIDDDTFILPSRNIACAYFSVEGDRLLRCDLLSGLEPPPDKPCQLDWVGAVMGAQGSANPLCAGDTVFDQSAVVRDYGRTWARPGITCESDESGLQCENDSAHGFFLSRARWDVF